MNLKGIKIGFCLTGSFCTFKKTIEQMKVLAKEEAEIIPIMSYSAYDLDTKFGKAEDFRNEIEHITGNKIIHTIQEAEPIGPKKLTDIMLIAPCSGNTIAKLSNGITDGPHLMAAKSHLRNNNPIVIAISTNDALSGSAENIGRLLNRKNYYFVPFRQDNPITKPNSLVFDSKYLYDPEQFVKIYRSDIDSYSKNNSLIRGWCSYSTKDLNIGRLFHIDIHNAYPHEYYNITGKTIDKARFGTVKCLDIELYQSIRKSVAEKSSAILSSFENTLIYWRTDGGIVLVENDKVMKELKSK